MLKFLTKDIDNRLLHLEKSVVEIKGLLHAIDANLKHDILATYKLRKELKESLALLGALTQESQEELNKA